MSTRLSLSVTSESPEVIARTVEHFARAITGLALEGVDCFLMAGPAEDDEEEES